jgi:hypothetical protein
MVCQGCGNTVETEIHFCPRCGAQMAAHAAPPQGPPTPPMPPAYAGYAQYPPYPPAVIVPRVQRHLQTLGILWCVFGAYRVLSGLMGLFFLRTFAWGRFGGGDWPFNRWGNHHWGDMHGHPWMAVVPFIVAITVVMASLAVVAGYGLLTRRSWARVFAIVLAVLALFKIPFGTALGIYTLWVLAPMTSGMEYDAIADRS